MRRTFERAATAIAMAVVLAGMFGCSAVKKSNRVSAATSSPAVVASPPAGTTSPGQLTQAAFNEDASSPDAPKLPARRSRRREVSRKVLQGPVAGPEQLLQPALPDPIQRTDMVLWQWRPASRHEGALVGLRAVRTRGHLRKWPLQHGKERSDVS